MAQGLNVVTVIGRVDGDIRVLDMINYTVAHFSIAVENYKGEDMIFSCVAFGKICKYLNNYCAPGDTLVLSGSLTRQADERGNPETAINVRDASRLNRRDDYYGE